MLMVARACMDLSATQCPRDALHKCLCLLLVNDSLTLLVDPSNDGALSHDEQCMGCTLRLVLATMAVLCAAVQFLLPHHVAHPLAF